MAKNKTQEETRLKNQEQGKTWETHSISNNFGKRIYTTPKYVEIKNEFKIRRGRVEDVS